MIFTHKIMQRFNFSHSYQQTKAFCPLLYSSFHHPILNSHARSYRRPGTSPDHIPFWKKNDFTLKNTAESLKRNFYLLFKEMEDHLRGPGGKPLKDSLIEQTTVVWDFRSPEDLQKWTASSDMEIGGKSQAFLKLGRNDQTALFYGVLNSEVPRDGETTSSGYCTLRSRPPKVCLNVKALWCTVSASIFNFFLQYRISVQRFPQFHISCVTFSHFRQGYSPWPFLKQFSHTWKHATFSDVWGLH